MWPNFEQFSGESVLKLGGCHMQFAAVHPLLGDNGIEAIRLKRLFAHAFGAQVLALLLPRLRLLRASRAGGDEQVLVVDRWSRSPSLSPPRPESDDWSR